MSFPSSNTYITDLRVGNKVIEHHKSTTKQYVSIVVSVDAKYVVVRRPDNSLHTYGVNSARIIYADRDVIPDYYLLQYFDPAAPTPRNPGAVSVNAEVLVPASNDANF